MKAKKISNETIKKYYKRFVEGEQYLIINETTGKIEESQKSYFWEQREVFNLLISRIEYIKQKYKVSDNDLYGRHGLISILAPYQRRYNDLHNKKYYYLTNLIFNPISAEDGSMDIDSVQEEGLTPGKVLIYRQGAQPPKIITSNNLSIDLFENEFNNIQRDIDNIIFDYIKILELKKEKKNNETNN